MRCADEGRKIKAASFRTENATHGWRCLSWFPEKSRLTTELRTGSTWEGQQKLNGNFPIRTKKGVPKINIIHMNGLYF